MVETARRATRVVHLCAGIMVYVFAHYGRCFAKELCFHNFPSNNVSVTPPLLCLMNQCVSPYSDKLLL
jgi:hypothetical protein